MQVDTNIRLNPDELEVFSIIKQVVEKYTPTTKAFAVGGWVRDKLLKIPSDDIDIMVDNISGEDFARLVTNFLGSNSAHIIRSNPEKSKNIETAKSYIPLSSGKTQEIDFARARSEVYQEGSRIPEIKPATPQEDAYRRDLTINSLMYNILENKVEDFTGKGIQDLITNTIRTPLDPLKTFSEDPLRIFRTIRFAAKYNGKIDTETYNAIINPSLRNEIKKKISKERIGTEFYKILKNPNSEIAIQLLKDTGLLEDIISESIKGTQYEGKLAELGMNQENPNHKLDLWGHTMMVIKNVLEKYKDAEPERKAVMTLAALMHDLGKLYKEIWAESKSHEGHRSYHGHEDESSKLVSLILKYLKLEPMIDEVSKLAAEHMRPHQLVRDEGGARALRRFIRQLSEKSLNWIDVFNLSVADAYSKDLIKDPNTVQEYQELEKRLQEAIVSLTPIDKPELKPILNGNEIMEALGLKPGPQIKNLLEFVKELKDENPNITKEEAIQKLKEKQLNKTAGKKEDKMATVCSIPLLKNKIEEINAAFKEENYYTVFSILDELKKEYWNDDNVIRLMAISIFKLLTKSEKNKYNDITQHVLDKAQENFFDNILCGYVLGILLILDTSTKDDIILDIGKRVSKMSPDLLRSILAQLPRNINREDLKKKIEVLL